MESLLPILSFSPSNAVVDRFFWRGAWCLFQNFILCSSQDKPYNTATEENFSCHSPVQLIKQSHRKESFSSTVELLFMTPGPKFDCPLNQAGFKIYCVQGKKQTVARVNS